MPNLPLAPNPLRQSAADAYRRARACIRHARLSPHCAERELKSAAYWRESALFWRAEAARDAAPVSLPPLRQWQAPDWRDEVNWLLRSPAALKAEVE